MEQSRVKLPFAGKAVAILAAVSVVYVVVVVLSLHYIFEWLFKIAKA